ncbi:MAG: BlaI/MecI/CopY family transcriptional regulator [Cyclobacteriaceae bacterium]|nr:BlaI/MecI/CopY family transcriptional regulator [Cyclobacteriaceae bacterium]
MSTAKPTKKELEILHVLWEKGPCSVKNVHEQMGGDQNNGYTTILKFLQIMLEKGIVSRQKSGKLHLYKAIANKENTKQQMVDKIIDTVFEGSASQLVISALGNNKSSKEELKAIRKYLDELEEGKQ